MSGIVNNATELIGKTPLLRATRFMRESKIEGAELLAKLECLNPAGSVKDRTAYAMVEDARKRGLLKPGAVLIEPTSGNTGIGLASVAAVLGYRTVIVLPDIMSEERRTLLRAYGAELILTEGRLGMKGAIEKAEALQRETPNSVILGQFVNPANPQIHEETTGPEIWEDTEGKVDFLVAGVGTGGTLTGAGRYLKKKNPLIRVVAVEPESSAVLSGRSSGAHGIQGIGAGFIPEILDTELYDAVITVKDEEALEAGRRFARTEGILAGISSGAALHAAAELAKREENRGKVIAVILPDSGDRYLSTKLFTE